MEGVAAGTTGCDVLLGHKDPEKGKDQGLKPA